MNTLTPKLKLLNVLQGQWLRFAQSKGSGFTLIELLVSIVIIGILASIALPSFLSQANRAKQSEAKQNLGSLNRAQQAYFTENSRFVNDNAKFGELGVGIPLETTNYSYQLLSLGEGEGAAAIATPKGSFKGYIGGVALVYLVGANDPVALTVTCESLNLGAAGTPTSANIAIVKGAPITGGGSIACTGNTRGNQ